MIHFLFKNGLIVSPDCSEKKGSLLIKFCRPFQMSDVFWNLYLAISTSSPHQINFHLPEIHIQNQQPFFLAAKKQL